MMTVIVKWQLKIWFFEMKNYYQTGAKFYTWLLKIYIYKYPILEIGI